MGIHTRSGLQGLTLAARLLLTFLENAQAAKYFITGRRMKFGFMRLIKCFDDGNLCLACSHMWSLAATASMCP